MLELDNQAAEPVMEMEDEYSDPEFDYEESDDMEDESEEFLDIDLRNMSNPSKCARYAERICLLAKKEQRFLIGVREKILELQDQDVIRGREQMIGRLICVQQRVQMDMETLFQAITLFNIALSKAKINLEELEPFAMTCLWMAEKLWERNILTLDDLCVLVSSGFKGEDFMRCERQILNLLDMRLGYPTINLFLQRFFEVIDAEEDIIIVSNFFSEASLISLDLLDFTPELVAISSVCMGKICLGEFCPTKRLMAYGHLESLDSIRTCSEKLLECGKKAHGDEKNAVWRKYEAFEMVQQMEISIDLLEYL
jgi:hypothetical protein